MKNKKNTALECAIVRDLLPLYHDGVVGSETKQAVSAHLDACKPCAGEYAALCRELPLDESNPTTREQFDRMMRRKKRRQRIVTAFTALAVSAALLVVGFFVATEVTVSFSDEIEVLRAYRYETDEGYKIFLLYTGPEYSTTRSAIDVEEGNTLVMDMRRTLISEKYEMSPMLECWAYDFGYETGDGGIIYQDFDTIKLGDRVIWSREENADDEIPDYVYAYDEFYFGRGDTIRSWSDSIEDQTLGANYADGRSVTWDFDGNIINDPA